MKKEPVALDTRVTEALSILQGLGFPRAQLNERSALTLLALLDLKPLSAWQEASAPLRGIIQMMDFFRENYGKKYEENTRETVRRQTIHQFLQAGLVLINPDSPLRPTNSPKTVYQIEAGALELLRQFGTRAWEESFAMYLEARESLQSRYAQERIMTRIPIIVEGNEITLSPGGHNILIQQILLEFAPRFTPGGRVLYIGDTDTKFAYLDQKHLARLGIETEAHGKMPDVVVHHSDRDWLVLIEAVTSHGPVSPKRRQELRELFSAYQNRLVFVTAFLTRKAMTKYVSDISWETEVWLADAPSHLIHFNGERFLGPYES